MRFGPWYRLSEAAEKMPEGPGVYQLRLEVGLVAYPRGRSAMVEYGAGGSLRARVAALAEARGAEPWLCRASRDPIADRQAAEAALARLLADFIERFGAAPRPPSSAE